MWANGLRICRAVLLAASLCWLSGCFGGSQNPSYFPWLLPTGDIIQTHAKPPGHGYYANFDPYAVRLEVRPLSSIDPVQTQHVIVATVYDAAGKPRRDRRVEWKLSGVGHILEVDESGCLPGRGWDLDGKNAVSYTNYGTHTMSRGNINPRDDFELRPGQTWCVVTSPVEGDTFVTVYAPEISNWDKRMAVVNVRWVDALWEFPAPAQARSGTQHVFTTKVFRYTDKQPLANYRVRYRITGGPPAVLLPSQTQEAVVVSDLGGLAQVAIAQKAPFAGVNTVEVEIIRPPDPTEPSGSGVSVAKGVTSVEWLAPSVTLTHSGPPAAGLGQEIQYTISVLNNGKIEAQSMTVTNPVPPGLVYIRSEPPAFVNKGTLTWALGRLPPGQAHNIKVFYQANKIGLVTNCAMVETEEGLKDQQCVTTDITEPRLKADITGPTKGVVGTPLNYTVTVDNLGSGPATDVKLSAKLSAGLEPQDLPPAQKNIRLITADQGTLKPTEQRVLPLKVVPLQPGKQTIEVQAVSGTLASDVVVATVDIVNPQLSVSLNGPRKRYVDRPAQWNISVRNDSDIALNNVVVRNPLPPQLIFEKATASGALNDKNEVVWDVGMLPPGQTRVLQVTTRSGKTPAQVNNSVVATAEYDLRREATATMLIEGVPALKMEAIDLNDPVEVGKQVTYQIELTNTGSAPLRLVDVAAKIPAELKAISASGPSANKIDPATQKVTFVPLAALEPGKTVKYLINCQAERAGDARFRVDVQSADLSQPVFEEEPTTVVGPATLLNTAPIKINPPGTTAIPPAPAVTPVPTINGGAVPPVPPPAIPTDAKPLPNG